jgi:hypothetical protein
MKSKRTLKAIAMVVCVAAVCVAFAVVALADNGGAAQEVLNKQRQIDKYLFEDHADDIAVLGFTVTHTAPMDTYVEIGITPFTRENADYLYGAFGSDMVKVVQGEQAVLLTGEASTLEMLVTDTAADIPQDILDRQAEIDKYLFEDHKDEIAARGFTVTQTSPAETYVEISITPYTEDNANYIYGLFGADKVKVIEGQQAVTLGNGEEQADPMLVSAEETAQASGFPVLVIVLAGAAVIVCVTAVMLARRKAAR